MIPEHSILWAGLILLIVNLIQFLHQKKLKERCSLMFYAILMTGLLLCVFSLFMLEPAGTLMMDKRTQFVVMSAGCYICIFLISYEMLRYARFRLNAIWQEPGGGKMLILRRILLAAGIIVTLLNIPGRFIYDADAAGMLQPAGFHTVFICCIVIVCMMDMCVMLPGCRRSPDRRATAMQISYAIMIVGIIAGTFRSDVGLMCFGIAVSINVMYITVNNPSTYLDSATDTFNLGYFRQVFTEMLGGRRDVHMLVIELYQLDRITRLYEKGIEEKLMRGIAEYLAYSPGIKSIFHTRSERFVAVAVSEEKLRYITEYVREIFSGSITVEGRAIRCAAALIEIKHAERFESIDLLMLYVRFLLRRTEMSGRLQIIAASEESIQEFYAEQEIERALESAVKNEMLDIQYQPIYSLKEGRFVSLEALSRLRHPAGSDWLSPEVFIRLAEECGSIADITCMQLRRICGFIRENNDLMEQIHDIKLNISALELGNPAHCNELIAILSDSGVPADKVRFEITETAVIHYTAEVESSIDKFRQAGIKLFIDDFGSGYADFCNLTGLPVDGVKLDRSLLAGIADGGFEAAFYKNIARALCDLGFTVVAEGIESAEEAELLGKWGVDMLQGYYFAKPMAGSMIRDFIKAEETKSDRM